MKGKCEMMNTAVVCLVALMAVCGCRREDVRDFTVSIPDLTPEKQAAVVEALAKYNGVKKDSCKWDFAQKTLTLRYDSMQIAKENIRQAIEAKNLKVNRP